MAQFAAARSAHREAIRHFDRGIGLLVALPEGPARDGQEVELQLARGLSLFTTEGFISGAASQAYARAREFAERRNDARQLFMAVYGQWQASSGSGRVVAGRGLSEKLLQLTADESDDGLRLQAHHSCWTPALFMGEPAAGREHADAGRRLYDPEICSCNMGGQLEWQLGHPDAALATSGQGWRWRSASPTR
jgi:hypothetical protein